MHLVLLLRHPVQLGQERLSLGVHHATTAAAAELLRAVCVPPGRRRGLVHRHGRRREQRGIVREGREVCRASKPVLAAGAGSLRRPRKLSTVWRGGGAMGAAPRHPAVIVTAARCAIPAVRRSSGMQGAAPVVPWQPEGAVVLDPADMQRSSHRAPA